MLEDLGYYYQHCLIKIWKQGRTYKNILLILITAETDFAHKLPMNIARLFTDEIILIGFHTYNYVYYVTVTIKLTKVW